MYDLDRLSLNVLLRVAKNCGLVERYRTTEWVVVLSLPSRELVMNHGNAQIFLQGLIYGASARDEKSASSIERYVADSSRDAGRVMLG